MFIAAGLLMASIASPCQGSLGALVPDERVAQSIAEAIIASRETPAQRSRYRIEVRQDGPDRWLVLQRLPAPPRDANGDLVIIMGGGGLGMRINRCDGAISDVAVQR